MNVWIAEWGPIGSSGEIIGVYEEEDTAKDVATANLDEDYITVQRAPVKGNYTWTDKYDWARVTAHWTE